MSVTGKRDGVSIPIIMLHDAEGGVVTVQTKGGELFRGQMEMAEDSMNIHMRDVLRTDMYGKTTNIKRCFIRGRQVLWIVVPDMLAKAPIFTRIKVWRKHKGNPPTFATVGAIGQKAAIMRKTREKADQVGGRGGGDRDAPRPAFGGGAPRGAPYGAPPGRGYGQPPPRYGDAGRGGPPGYAPPQPPPHMQGSYGQAPPRGPPGGYGGEKELK
ncbi:unnamed protein product [Chrysoparadoxa australica]